jgi:hypothetical protein
VGRTRGQRSAMVMMMVSILAVKKEKKMLMKI